MSDSAFWRRKGLSDMSHEEWESLCDGCGKCCLHKLEDKDNGAVVYTNVACRLLDLGSCRCTGYDKRTRWVPECIELSRQRLEAFAWLPGTCAYRLLAEGKDLPDWHPLVSGDPCGVHAAGVSVRAWAVSERQARRLDEHIIAWKP